MKRIIRIGGCLVLFATPAIHAQVLNINNSFNYPQIPGYAVLFSGQGAYSDPGNNVWNGFGAPNGPGSTWYYGGGNPWNATVAPAVPNNPGNPYASYGAPNAGTTSSGPTVWGQAGGQINGAGSPTGSQSGNANSAGFYSPVTLSITYGFNNGANGGTVQGQPSWLFGRQAGVNSSSPGAGTVANPMGSLTLHNVPTGGYLLYLYGANYDADRGSIFAVSSGSAHNGIDRTANNGNNTVFTEGANYVYFENVTPDGNGDINVTWIYNPAAANTGGLEASFNGLQLIAIPEPSSLALLGVAGGLLFLRRRR